MIKLTRMNETDILVNESFIETVEETPDTVVTMQNGHRYFVK
ncbi:MAG: flagellar FlbD family protein, partial [Huintestinicola sp.]